MTEKNLVDVVETVEEYLGGKDWRIKANANQSFSLGGLILNGSGKMIANYWLERVFSNEASKAHREGAIHIHDLDILGGYCAGWSLRDLLERGFGGAPGAISSKPPKHLSSACGQIINFFGSLQNEWAGAQAFSSFDTYMAPFVRMDNLSFEEVKQNLQELIFNLNVPSRWGCVPTSTQVLSTKGWRNYDELKEGDSIYSWSEGNLVVNTVQKVVVKEFDGVLQSFKGRNYTQTVTPNHRVLCYDHNSRNSRIRLAEEIFDVKTPYSLPTKFMSSSLPSSTLKDDEITLAAMIYTDGSINWRNGSVHKVTYYKSLNRYGGAIFERICDNLGMNYSKKIVVSDFGEDKGYGGYEIAEYTLFGKNARRVVELVQGKDKISPRFLSMDSRQSSLFLDVWAKHDGDFGKMLLQCDNETIVSQIQHIALRAGYTSYLRERRNTNYVKLRKVDSIIPSIREEKEYSGLVWCPSVDAGTAIFRSEDGNVFISGQSQAPFTNLTFDWEVPDDLAPQHPIIGGVEQDFIYGDLQEEMAMINKAFLEALDEGDAHGRPFTFPIPTYNITPDFDWNSENANLLFDHTAKTGSAYFQNFLNSDLDPGMIRSMCPLTSDTKVLVHSKERGIRSEKIGVIANAQERRGTIYEVWTPKGWREAKPVKTPMTDVFEITLSNGETVKMGENHFQPTKDNGTLQAKDLRVGMWLPYNKKVVTSSKIGNFNLGYVIGAYLGDGSTFDSIVTYSLNNTTKKKVRKRLEKIWKDLGYKTTLSKDKTSLRVKGDAWTGVLSRFVNKGRSTDKSIKDFLLEGSPKMRLGVIKGLADTDGSRSRRRIYTSSYTLAQDVMTIFASLGEKARLGNVDNREGKMGENPIYRVDYPSRDSYGKFFDTNEEFNYYSIVEICNVGKQKGFLYCFEVQDVDPENHLFSLSSGLVTHNCRLQLNLTELLKRGNGLFGSAELTGSIGVVTINLARLGYLFRGDKEALLKELDRLSELASDVLEARRKLVQELMDSGLYPYSKHYMGHLNNHFSTIGVNGMNELVRNYTEDSDDITSKFGHDLSVEILDHLRDKMVQLQERTGNMYNLEATPAEGTTYRFAKEDRKRYPDILQAGSLKKPYYTNSSQLPGDFTTDPFEALIQQEELQGKYTGGTVLHLYMGEAISSGEVAKKLLKKALSSFRVPYLTITPTFSICPTHLRLNGEFFTCPECAKEGVVQECEVWTRVMGYFRPVQSFNIGKQGEYEERTAFQEEALCKSELMLQA